MDGTTVFDAKAALLVLLKAHTWTGGPAPDVAWGPPTEAEDQAMEMVYFGETTVTAAPTTLGMTRHDESYVLRIVVDVRQYGDYESDVERRAWEIATQVFDVLRLNPTLSDVVNRMGPRTSRQVNVPSPAMWRSQIVIDQDVVGLVYYTP